MAGRPKTLIQVSSADEAELKKWIEHEENPSSLAFRAQIILLSNQGINNAAIAKRLDISAHAVGRWRKRFIEQGLNGLHDSPRSGAPHTISQSTMNKVLKLCREQTQSGKPKWSCRSIAKQCSISHDSVHRIRQRDKLKTHNHSKLLTQRSDTSK
ncbi:helix-turn-helix domain-containing protein [Rubritalea spongiae]|uniref:Helix-turn-helix domain-containing protein n=1 Tax=Rubritalea spongiae TaxID=430797 RepID=A0ABW5E1B7_9BACT